MLRLYEAICAEVRLLYHYYFRALSLARDVLLRHRRNHLSGDLSKEVGHVKFPTNIVR